MKKIRFVIATRETEAGFLSNTATGRSLSMYRLPFVELVAFTNNKGGLPKLYNMAIDKAAADPAVLVFAHDDLHILDYHWAECIFEALESFDVVGLAGNRRRVPNQPAWAFVDRKFTWDSADNLSGTVGHGKGFPPTNLSVFGKAGQQVKLLDGLMLITNSQTLIDTGLRFDEQFDFHFYDMDFCRQAELKGLRMGTWPLSVIHESGGSFGSESWQRGYDKYLAKWTS